MKVFFLFISILFFRLGSSQTQVEWIKELPNDASSSRINIGIKCVDDKIFTILKGEMYDQPAFYVSYLYKLDSKGKFLYVDTAWKFHFNTLQVNKDAIYILGSNQKNNQDNLMKRDLSGAVLWKKNLIWKDDSYLFGNDGLVLNGSLYTTMYLNDLLKYDVASGNQIWRVPLAINPNTTSVDNIWLRMSQGYIYLYSVFYGQEEGARILKYDTLGNQIWKIPCGTVTNMTTDDQGNCYLVYWNTIVKINSEGQTVWSKTQDSLDISNCQVHHDSLYICGKSIAYQSQPGFKFDDVKCGFSVLSTITGETFNSHYYNFYQGYGEGFTQILKTDDAIFLAGAYSMYPAPFLVKLSTNPPTSIQANQPFSSLLNIFPNPVNNQLTINGNFTSQPSKLTIKNSLGQVVLEKEISNNIGEYSEKMDVSALCKGVYILELSNGSGTETRKIVIE